MGKKIVVMEPLTDAMVEAGAELIRKLDEAGMPPDIALWRFNRDVSEWRLLLSSPAIGTEGPRRMYEQIHVAIKELGDKASALPFLPVNLVAPHSDLVKHLKAETPTGPGLDRRRLRTRVSDGRYIDNALIYRVA